MKKTYFIRTIMVAAMSLVFCLTMAACASEQEPNLTLESRQDFHLEQLGENVYIFSPDDDPTAVQQTLDEIYNKQEDNQFGEERYSVYFLPGEYSDEISVKVGFYTQVAGLGASPDDVSLKSLDCEAHWLPEYTALCNFWRGVENLSVKDDVMWAVSQATFMRRVHLYGNLALHENRGACSGGFLSNAKVEYQVDAGTQQQWLSRNCDWQEWAGGAWNIVCAGVPNEVVPTNYRTNIKYTSVPAVERIREKPFLAYDKEKGFGVYVPKERTNAVGVDWTPGDWIDIKSFYIAKPTDTADSINNALSKGKHLFLTPGIYELDKSIVVEKQNTVVLGSGLATLRSMQGKHCMEVKGDVNVTLAGILFDAGPNKTECLLSVGEKNAVKSSSESTLLSDLFFRVGGAKTYNTDVQSCVDLHQDDIIGDNFWIWRADHGAGVGWNKNKAANGIRVTGDNVTVYALMVEHFQEYQTLWEGNDGKVIFYQCEIPYDVPNQDVWKSSNDTVNGYASYKIADGVNSHEAYGLGIYLYNRDAEIELHSAMEIPKSATNIRIHFICTVMLGGHPGMSHIINDFGNGVTQPNAREFIVEYP